MFLLEIFNYLIASSAFNWFSQFNLICCDWFRSRKMSVVPPGAFAAIKYRQNQDKMNDSTNMMRTDLSPPKYSSKYMNSIWGSYNRYSVHNLKKIMDEGVLMQQRSAKDVVGQTSVDKNSTDYQGSLNGGVRKGFLFARTYL